MVNFGNTCYINSSLQALFHVPAFVNWLQSESRHLQECNGESIGDCIICAMYRTYKSSQNILGIVIKPILIYRRLKYICNHFAYGREEDAHEFMRYLLHSMEEAYLAGYIGEKLDTFSRETTPINQIFGGYIRTEVTCSECGSVSTTFQHCQDFLLDIEHVSTVDDALDDYFSTERLDGDDAYYCRGCNKKVVATRKFSLEKNPQVLCLQFKRFNFSGRKIEKHVTISERLDITRFLCPSSAHHSSEPLIYHLVSMVTHIGLSVKSGHYTAVAGMCAGHYFEFDDKLVYHMSVSEVLETNAYILLYECEPCEEPEDSLASQQREGCTTATRRIKHNNR
ncbi:ubiquitin carboxyl-terminal hydrolase 36-like [Zootermopsis nevadensis]|uniref:Ubiquitin carboxyl-terminal hydrolase 36 n=1 Tax=Zootermopsis nevadensis TaxID=136037 RepID=A0A067RIC5_ZOONE|nr:ubiquitin carboxyl-terminal hydrolase 36-like [Zootermopsis nevadensis]XP_021918541.1 ubiquitin carboxyl-terminal hydrolase 36-like [Zootermopsis nevadensis]XP_021918542.1 ubiquitin carboxyl-terminal hydrolase 36-like [Zootermopsis nevadensis]XP_021918543.1 ubiquitin carboxyl-terminal hydrolase 36-like [Zootermopsis nevadensis]XP_021918544.1 ubiquitin carboxyl-terminal hydrolase 36-like [Zootermopsis nevadensis]XP_021918545.1 ubiquitin carboxyl-terminal hydrolase 36-like [Zootermopsis nevad